MKRLALIAPVLLLVACRTGEISVESDDFTQEKIKTLDVGQVNSAKAMGLIYEIRAFISRREKADNTHDYFIKLTNYSEGAGCPKIKSGSRAIFIVDGKPVEYSTTKDTIILDNQAGLTAKSCSEMNILIGPIAPEVMERMLQQQKLRFKVYGSQYNVEGFIEKDDLQMMKQIMK